MSGGQSALNGCLVRPCFWYFSENASFIANGRSSYLPDSIGMENVRLCDPGVS